MTEYSHHPVRISRVPDSKLEKEMATHSSGLVWKIPGMGEPGGLLLWGHVESDTTEST